MEYGIMESGREVDVRTGQLLPDIPVLLGILYLNWRRRVLKGSIWLLHSYKDGWTLQVKSHPLQR